MSVIQMSPCIVSEKWSEVVEWCARILDLPVACRFASEGWARLSAASEGIMVVDPKDLRNALPVNAPFALDLEVRMLRRVVERAKHAGAKIVMAPTEGSDKTVRAVIETPQGVTLWLRDKPRRSDGARDVHQGPLHFTVGRKLAAPPARVFEAVTRKQDLEAFFVNGVKGNLAQDAESVWTFDGYGDFTLQRMELKVNEFLSFHWQADKQSYDTRVQFALTPAEGGTELTITESGWDQNPQGFKKAFDNCEGWTTFLANLAMFLEHDIAAMKA